MSKLGVAAIIVGVFVVLGAASYTVHSMRLDKFTINAVMGCVAVAIVVAVLWYVLPLQPAFDAAGYAENIEQQRQRRERMRAALGVGLAGKPYAAIYLKLFDAGHTFSAAKAEECEQRLMALAEPERAQYADRIRRGEIVTPAMMAYDRDPALLMLCEHLRAVERDLRKADPAMTMNVSGKEAVTRSLGFAWPELRTRYALPEFVTYYEDDPRDGFSAWLHCQDCGDRIECLPVHRPGFTFPAS